MKLAGTDPPAAWNALFTVMAWLNGCFHLAFRYSASVSTQPAGGWARAPGGSRCGMWPCVLAAIAALIRRLASSG